MVLSDRPPICRVKMEFGLGGRRGKKRGGIVRVEQKEKKRLKAGGFSLRAEVSIRYQIK